MTDKVKETLMKREAKIHQARKFIMKSKIQSYDISESPFYEAILKERSMLLGGSNSWSPINRDLTFLSNYTSEVMNSSLAKQSSF